LNPWTVIPSEPPTQSIQPREQHTLGDIRLIQLVADLPFQLGGDDDAAIEIRPLFQPVVKCRFRITHQREQRELINDAIIE